MAKPISALEPVKSVSSLDELEALLAEYKKANPVKYEVKEKNGEFEKLRKQCSPAKSKS